MKPLTILATLLAMLTGCDKYTNLDADAFEALLGEGQVCLLDVRTPEEYAAGALPGAANADWNAQDFLQQVAQLCPQDKPVAVYCRTGRRSAAAASALVKAGYTVYNLLGGYEGWSVAGKETLTDDEDRQYASTMFPQGTEVPDFTLNDLEGRPVSLSDFRGKTVVLVFWASWCPDCRAEIPELKEMQDAADPDKVVFVSVSFDRTLEALKTFVADQQLGGVQLFDPAGKKDSEVGAAFGIKWIPSLYVISPEGKVVLRTVLAGKVAAVLKGKSPAGIRFNLGQLCSDEYCAQ